MKKILVVGAGFAGAVIARELANTGEFEIDVIDKRDHIGGNAYDTIHEETGARYHKYGPHIFHTNDKRIFDYLSQFTHWIAYQHKVEANVERIGDVPLPVNMTTINKFYRKNYTKESEINKFLESISIPNNTPANAEEFLQSIYGEQLTEVFFSRYTKKMWGLELHEMPTSVVARIPVRKDDSREYFNDSYQFMPKNGYTTLFENLLDHPAIRIFLNREFERDQEKPYFHIFNSMAIDDYFGYCFGELPYRSIIFEHRINEAFEHKVPTVNFTNTDRYTRKTNWDLYPSCGGGKKRLVTYEAPCDYNENNKERFYPVKTVTGNPQATYEKYREKAKLNSKTTFIGRCGQYIYYDMHQVVANSIKIANLFKKNFNICANT